MTKAQQKRMSIHWKRKAERRLKVLLRPWYTEMSAEYRIGDSQPSESATNQLIAILRRSQAMTSKDILGFDIREFKQDEEEVLNIVIRNISKTVSDLQVRHNTTSVRSIMNTVSKWMRRVSSLAISNEWTEREAMVSLQNYLRGQSITVATTEAQWAVETTRAATVMAVTDPLQNSVITIANLFRADDNVAARKLAKKVEKLARLAISENQGRIVGQVSRLQSDLIGPEAQARAIANVENMADRLGVDKRTWEAVFIRTRPEHAAADGQEQDIDTPFVVGGEMLMYPGDGSLGASLWNIINCMCSAAY